VANKDEILMNLLAAVSNDYDKRPGSFIYDALAPVAGQIAMLDESMGEVKSKLSIDNLSGTELEQRINERTGITRKTATKATGSVRLTGTGTIKIGDLFETPGAVQFVALETKYIVTSGMVSVEAIVPGSSGNVAANTITLFPVTLTGFTAVTNPNPTRDGFDAESDADLIQRYYDHIRTPATSGNVAHYKNWAKEVSGVGDAKVIPLWKGNNTVKVVIINSDKEPASPSIVADVQDYIDPGISGLGNGAAPIGAFATVVSAAALNINIKVDVSLTTGSTLQQVIDNISADITQYLREIAYVEPIVSVAKIGSIILSRVKDYSNLTLNGGTGNVPIGEEEVAVLGTVNVNVT